MIHLIWSLINLAIVLYFFYLIVGFIRKGKQFFKQKFKLVSILILLVGFFHIISAANSEEITNHITITEDFNSKNASTIKKVKLEDNLTFDINLIVKYSIDNNECIPIHSKSFLVGFISGHQWELKSIQTNTYRQK